jgi:hypothetical protein
VSAPPARSASRRAALLLLPTLLAGCKLIDQTTFAPTPKPVPPPPPPPPGPPPVPPLIDIRFDQPGVNYDAAVRQAVRAALARKRDVVFDVIAIAPTAPTLQAQLQGLNTAEDRLHSVAGVIARQGVAPAQIRLSARTEPGVTAISVRVFIH